MHLERPQDIVSNTSLHFWREAYPLKGEGFKGHPTAGAWMVRIAKTFSSCSRLWEKLVRAHVHPPACHCTCSSTHVARPPARSCAHTRAARLMRSRGTPLPLAVWCAQLLATLGEAFEDAGVMGCSLTVGAKNNAFIALWFADAKQDASRKERLRCVPTQDLRMHARFLRLCVCARRG